ncbi:hypothetical protein WA158_008379 [Blastocystis sp. Blastoise]
MNTLASLVVRNKTNILKASQMLVRSVSCAPCNGTASDAAEVYNKLLFGEKVIPYLRRGPNKHIFCNETPSMKKHRMAGEIRHKRAKQYFNEIVNELKEEELQQDVDIRIDPSYR